MHTGMKIAWKSLKEHVIIIINFEQKEEVPLTNKRFESYAIKECHICKKKLVDKYTDDKKLHKVRDCCHYTAKHKEVLHIVCII